MRAAVAVTCALLLPSIRSGAQPTPTPVPPVPVPLPAADNMCTGVQAPEATFSIVVEQDNGTFVAVDRKLTNSVINGQDCACDAQDLFLQAFVIRGLPNGTQPTFSVWEGAGCEAPMARTSTCEQVNATVAPSDFWAGSANSAPRQRIDVRALLTPDPTASPGHPTEHTCPASNVGNAVFFLFGPTNAPSFCAVPIQVGAVPPTPAQEVSAVSGDGGVTLNWQSPPVGSALIPVSYQVLCADENGEPLPGEGAVSLGEPINDRHQLGYSTCIDAAAHVIERRVITTTGTTSTGQNGQTGQNGRRKIRRGSPARRPAGRGAPLAIPAAIVIVPGVPLDPNVVFDHLEKRFVCSDIMASVGLKHSLRIDNLDNGKRYFFTVVAIDQAGNPSPSPVVTAQAEAVEDMYRRFRDLGGEAQGFCFIATAAFGSYQSPYVKVLRDFRDRALLPRPAGRAFVSWYYRSSPPWAAWIAERPVARWVTRQVLWIVIAGAALWLWAPAWIGWLVLLGGGALGMRRLVRRRANE